ncbi:MAG: TolC family protein [Planctomycetaceae bacterium]|nr:TolC family protein [Planctomycetaceae bacterium]
MGLSAYAQISKLPTPALPPASKSNQRIKNEKYLAEIWNKLENGTFATPTFEYLSTNDEGYSFDELWEIAQITNPSLSKKSNLITAAKGKYIQSGLYPNPILIYSCDSLTVHGNAGKHGLAVTQEIVTARKQKLNRTAISYDVTTARKEYSMEQIKLQNDLRIAYYEILHAILVSRVEHFTHEISHDLLKVAKTLQSEGKSNAIDVLRFQTLINAAELTYRQAENNKITKWQNLLSVIGIYDLPYQSVRGTLIDPTPRRDKQLTWIHFQKISPQLELARLKIAQSKTQLEYAKAGQIPNVYATVSLAYDIPAKTKVPFVGIAMPLTIYNKNQGNITKAIAEIAIANRELERLTLSFHKQMTNIFCQYNNACELIHVYEKTIIPDTFETLRQIGENYCNGKMTYLELYAQRKIVISVLLQYIDALKTKAVTTTQIDGMMLEGTLD